MVNENTIKILKRKVVVPPIVEKKAAAAFAVVQEEAQADEAGKPVEVRTYSSGKKRRRRFSASVAAAAVAVFILGSTAVFATANWSGFMNFFTGGDGGQQQELVEQNLVASPSISDTENGVTIEAKEAIVDHYLCYLTFKITGWDYDPDSGSEPWIDFEMEVKDPVDGNAASGGGGLHRRHFDKNSYLLDDGSIEYVWISSADQAGYFIGKDISVKFSNLGTISGREQFIEMDAVWNMDFTLPGKSAGKTISLDQDLGDTGVNVSEVELSPVSCLVRYKITEPGVYAEQIGEAGEEDALQVPALRGVKLKDGTLYPFLYILAREGYTEENSDDYQSLYSLERTVDPDEIESLLFYKDSLEEESDVTEDNFYVIPVR